MVKNYKDYKILTNFNPEEKDQTFDAIYQIICEMCRNGVIFLGNGYCISMSDMIRTALLQKDIRSRLVEATCTITKEVNNREEIIFIGFDDAAPNQIDSHVVLLTETDQKWLIDASIQRFLPGDFVAFVGRIDNYVEYPNLTQFANDEFKIQITHSEKSNAKIPLVHHRSILERIEMDSKIEKNINLLKKLNYIGISLSVFAVIAVINQFFRWFI